MAELRITIVGNDILDQVCEAVKLAGIRANPINRINDGKLGNFTTLMMTADISEEELIAKRRTFMDAIVKNGSSLMALYEHGDWMRVYIFKRNAWKSRAEQLF